MKPEIERAMREVLEAWEAPDSPEAMVGAIYQLRRVYESDEKVMKKADKSSPCPMCKKPFKTCGHF